MLLDTKRKRSDRLLGHVLGLKKDRQFSSLGAYTAMKKQDLLRWKKFSNNWAL